MAAVARHFYSIALLLAGACALAASSSVYAQEVCGSTCDVFQPRWFAFGGVVYMDRATEDSQPLMQNVTSPALQLNARDFDFDWNVGLDVSLSKRFWDESGIELRYLDLGQLEASTMATTNATSLRLNASTPVFVPNVQTIDARYATHLLSAEANYQHAISDEFKVLCGLRYLSLDDDLIAVLDDGAQALPYMTLVRNDLYGIQVGAIGTPCEPLCCGFLATCVAKIGVYGNDLRQRSRFDTGVTALSASESPGRETFVGELVIGIRRPIGPYVTVGGGYGLIWLERVAVASDQLRNTDFFNGTGSSNRGNALFHGAQLAVEVHL